MAVPNTPLVILSAVSTNVNSNWIDVSNCDTVSIYMDITGITGNVITQSSPDKITIFTENTKASPATAVTRDNYGTRQVFMRVITTAMAAGTLNSVKIVGFRTSDQQQTLSPGV